MPASNSDARKRIEEARADLARVLPVLEGMVAAVQQETTIVALSGWAQSGKDTTANVFANVYGYDKLAFADRLRAVAAASCQLVEVKVGCDPWKGEPVHSTIVLPKYFLHDPEGYEWLKANTTYREYLQDLGTAVREELGELAWVNAALDRVVTGGKYVITDCRYKNEAEAVRARGGQVWRVERVGHHAANDHISEHDLDDYEFDRVLTLPDFHGDLLALNAYIESLIGATGGELSKAVTCFG